VTLIDFREDYYRVLGVAPNATAAEIREAWLRLISYWHPDRTNHQAAEARAKELNRAYQILSDEPSRTEYDEWYQSQDGIPSEEASFGPAEVFPQTPKASAGAPANGPLTWQAPPTDYRHHPGVDPFTGRVQAPGGRISTLAYISWVGGFAAWLTLLALSTALASAVSSPTLVTSTLVLDVMGLWTWLFAIAALFRHKPDHWRRFWGAELLGALTATSATLMLGGIVIAAAVLLTQDGLNAFRQRAWMGAALAILLLAGLVGALTFRFVLQRWEEIKSPPRHVPQEF
jgi:hypothetical protein